MGTESSAEAAEFSQLCTIVSKLLGNGGCAWSSQQTVKTYRKFLLEEIYELMEAIDAEDANGAAGEVGDLLFNLVFICQMAARDGLFNLAMVLHKINEKLIRRSPHIFGDGKGEEDVGNIMAEWQRIKNTESEHIARRGPFSGIPQTLPALARAHKMLQKMPSLVGLTQQLATCQGNHKAEGAGAVAEVNGLGICADGEADAELQIGAELMKIVGRAHSAGLNAEQCLLKTLSGLERTYGSTV
mmetsp:Transcript_31086/g.52344  ORF Transcript_31086/g.52344 Transcript_31086/m.52344 type:complete len:243 (-) Transcript_31086:705-1433(-)|eukprot:CAMPEP_0184337818 /NCGR_PEP_ID=MMETSP1089-20130417/6265_1 /TAXON_ID=38269 ORGANISM="Gloeochaete wittrockiana, Strain SAG46.84" /NCGR_SAMPLE_ID=MMETSP1089 /ASSEMBLY_ACC=CAM_ASM_000445 /LENGTH=242 /DNA_ID=CAMNT_0026663863 /DNA_START=76 /DNA_END=804 /DNA_ORIENTATION=-